MSRSKINRGTNRKKPGYVPLPATQQVAGQRQYAATPKEIASVAKAQPKWKSEIRKPPVPQYWATVGGVDPSL